MQSGNTECSKDLLEMTTLLLNFLLSYASHVSSYLHLLPSTVTAMIKSIMQRIPFRQIHAQNERMYLKNNNIATYILWVACLADELQVNACLCNL